MNNKEYKQLDGFSRYGIYADGTIINLLTKKAVGTVNANGYVKATLTDNVGQQHALWVHRVVWQAFNGEIPRGLEVCHLDDDKTNNRLDNLVVATHKVNCNMGSRNAKISATLRAKNSKGGNK